MAVLNTSPDSFSDGGEHSPQNMPSIVNYVKELEEKSQIDILDIGGESSRPGSEPVSSEEEYKRVIPVIAEIRSHREFDNILISVDTSKSFIAEESIKSGANIINDITAGRDPKMFEIVKKYNVPIVLMHMRGTPKDMQKMTDYTPEEVLPIIAGELKENINAALEKGIFPWKIITDPGIGFSKKIQHNIQIFHELQKWPKLIGNYPLLIGPSRKSFIGTLTSQKDPKNRKWGTAASVTAAISGGAHIVRVHDAIEMSQVIKVSDAIYKLIGYGNE